MAVSITAGPVDITADIEDATWEAGINGGYATLTLTTKGPAVLPLLQAVTVTVDGLIVWEGFVSENSRQLGQGQITSRVTCSGWQRALDWDKAILPYSVRDIAWKNSAVGNGQAFISGAATFNFAPDARGQITIGQFDQTDTTKRGIKFCGDSVALAASEGVGVEYTLPAALTEAGKIRATITASGAGVGSGVAQMSLYIGYSSNGSSWTATQFTGSGTADISLPAGTQFLRVGWRAGTSGLTPAGTDLIEVKSIRILGTTVTEDNTATATQEGFYPTTLIRDIISRQTLIGSELPAITDFFLSSFGSFQYQSLRDLLSTLFAYLPGFWGVYENRQLQYRRFGRSASVHVNSCDTYTIRDSAELATQQVIVTYTDATSQLPAAATSTISSGVFSNQPVRKEDVYQAGVMTAHTASVLASQIATIRAQRPTAAATIRVPLFLSCEIGPAAHLKPGDQITLLGVQGLESNVFDVIETSCSMSDNTMTLSLGYYAPDVDVLLARLAQAQTVAV